MKLEVGKSYKTRRGDSAIIFQNYEHPIFSYKGKLNGSVLTWAENGSFCGEGTVCDLDLVAEWEDEQPVTYTTPQEALAAMSQYWPSESEHGRALQWMLDWCDAKSKEQPAAPRFPIEAWDQYACAVLPVAMRLSRPVDAHPESYAKRSGLVADAMMLEREKRIKQC